MANYKKTRRHGRSKRQKRQSLKRNNRTFGKVMSGGGGNGMSFIIDPREITGHIFSDPMRAKPLQGYNVLVEYLNFPGGPLLSPKQKGTIHIYGYEFTGSFVRLDATLTIINEMFTPNTKFRRMKFSFGTTYDGYIQIVPEKLLTVGSETNGKIKAVNKIQVISSINPRYGIDGAPVSDLLFRIETERRKKRLKELDYEEEEDKPYWTNIENKGLNLHLLDTEDEKDEWRKMMARYHKRHDEMSRLNTSISFVRPDIVRLSRPPLPPKKKTDPLADPLLEESDDV